eukprot:12494864-Ditylum_brightwellii.AAC.1
MIWLVIPAMNFIAAFSKLGYMGIKKVLGNHGFNYAKHIIVQSSDLKEKLEACGLKRNNVTLMLLDIVNMYPSIRVKLIRKALNHYAKDLPAKARETISLCMDIVQFEMKSTLIQFKGCYFVFQGATKAKEISDEDIVLAIGAYESAFLADIVASYVFKETEECFVKCIFRGIYRDDGLV